MSCCSNYGNRGAVSNYCDSSAFDSSCTDEGQGHPLSIKVGCAIQAGAYEPIPGVVAVWDGEQWLLEGDDSSSTDSSSVVDVVIADILSVGGGGGGGSGCGDGGGGGEVTYGIGVSINPLLSYAVTVGVAGTGGSAFVAEAGTSGGQSDFDGSNVALGGSGGAGGLDSGLGAGGDGSGSVASGSNGGNGTLNSISGASLCYGGGGGGGGEVPATPGGDGGGCIGSDSGSGGAGDPAGTPASSLRGGGGGGGNQTGPGGNGLNGADGMVVIRYPGVARFTGGTITTDAGDTIHTFTSSGSLDPA